MSSNIKSQVWRWRFLVIAGVLLTATLLFNHGHTSPSAAASRFSDRIWKKPEHAASDQTVTVFNTVTATVTATATVTNAAAQSVSTSATNAISPGISTYEEGSVKLTTYVSPFVCDIANLPAQVRMTLWPEKYAIYTHGQQEVVSDGLWAGGWEHHVSQQMDAYMQAVMSIDPARDGYMDLGTNIGAHAIYFAARKYHVHMFEPTFANQMLVRCSLAMNGDMSRVRLNVFGVGDTPNTVCMAIKAGNMGMAEVNGGAANCDDRSQARIGTLNTYYSKFLKNQQKFAVVKMDIQGFENHALRSGTSFFDSDEAPAAVFFEYDPELMTKQGTDPRALPKYFQDRDYSIYQEGNSTAIPYDEFPTRGYISGTNSDPDLIALSNKWKKKLQAAGHNIVGAKLVAKQA